MLLRSEFIAVEAGIECSRQIVAPGDPDQFINRLLEYDADNVTKSPAQNDHVGPRIVELGARSKPSGVGRRGRSPSVRG
jgi:hypothetical protein